MKNIIIIMAVLAINTLNVSGQTFKQTHNLLISVYDQDLMFSKTRERIIVTKDDGSQEESIIKVPANSFQPGHIKDKEDSVMAMLKPYFNDGWKLVTSYAMIVPGTSGGDILTRYFLRREE